MDALNGAGSNRAPAQLQEQGYSAEVDKKRRNHSSDSDFHLAEDGGSAFLSQKPRLKPKNKKSCTLTPHSEPQIQSGTSSGTQALSGVYLEALDKRKLNDFAVAKKLHAEGISFRNIFSKGYSQLLIRFATLTEANSLINNLTLLQNLHCSAQLSAKRPDVIKGVIRGVYTEFTETDMLTELEKSKHFTAVKVKRMTRIDDQLKRIDTPSVVIDFKGTVLPRSVGMFGVSRTVEVYVTKPTICFNCHIFGHIAKQCKSPSPVCGYCAGKHNTKECKKEESVPLCINCSGAHNPNSLECPVMRHKHEARLQKALQTTPFQKIPTASAFNMEFPDLPNHEEESAEADLHEREPSVLPRKTQRAAVRKFSDVTINRLCTDQEKFERRQSKYQTIIQHTNRQNQQNTPRQKKQPPARLQQTHHPQEEIQQAPTGVNVPNIDMFLTQLLSNKRALTLLLSLLQIVLSSIPQQTELTDPVNIQNIQQQLLSMWQKPTVSRTDKSTSDHSTEMLNSTTALQSGINGRA